MVADPVVTWMVTALGAVFAGAVFYFVGRRVERRAAEVAGGAAHQQAERHLPKVVHWTSATVVCCG